MNAALEMARGFLYLATIQDDMQFVRPLDQAVLDEYATIFASNPKITQIDPRFVRDDGSQVRRCSSAPAFEWIETYPQTYSDVGIFSVERLTGLGWSFVGGEKANRERARTLGMVRVYPFTPIAMHVPFPSSLRHRERNRRRFLVRPGSYKYKTMSPEDQREMDTRPPHVPPIFRNHLKIEGFGILDRVRFKHLPDNKIFR